MEAMQAVEGQVGSAPAFVTITVKPALTFSGFAAPVATGSVTTVRSGSVLPLRWALTSGGQEVSSLDAIAAGYPRASQADCATGQLLAGDATASPGRTVLRYDTDAHQYVWNWQSPQAEGTCWSLDVRLSDNTDHAALVRLR